ncbi:hypothetical protein B0J14DRAFT_372585 [Halenospora varia]|nr:hypothetical protein B0J14DRAFT_372585 [Halenospora varia]
MLPFPNPPRKRMWRAQSDPFVPSNVPGLCMSDADPVTIPIDFTGNPGDNDVLQNFDFDSFLRQDSPPPNRDYTLNVDALGKHTPRGGQSSVSQPDIDEDPYRIKCICEYSDDDGDTIYCEACDTWQHIKCFYPDQIAHALDTEDHLCADCKPRPLDRQLATERQGQQREMKRINDDEGRKKTQRHTKSHKKKAKCADNQFDSYSSCGKRARSSHRLVNDYDHHHSQKVEKTNAEQVAEYQMNILKNMNCRVRNRKPLPLNQVIVPTFEDLTVGWAGPSPGPTEVQSPSPLLPGIDASSGAQKDVVRPWLPIPMDPSIEDDRPLFVNPKQFDRIVKRRRVRQEQEDSRKRCKQESSQDISDEDISMDQSSLHSGLAPAPPATELVLDASKSVVADARNPPSSGSRIWLQAYENLQASHSSIFGTLAHEFGVFGVEDTKICARLSNLVGLLPKTDFDKIRGTENIFAIRENVIYVVTMVDQQMGLESATIGWCCIWAYVKMYDQIFARHAISPFRENIISKIEVSFLQLLDVTGIIARYAVMENLYQQSGGALSLKEDYQASLISLCESMIRFLAEVYDQGRLFEQVSYTNIPLRTSNVMDEVRRKDEACRAFKVVVDVKEESDSDSEITEEEEGEDLSDGSWEAVEVGK